MITHLALVCFITLIVWYGSGARHPLYLLFFLSFVPFVTLDASAGGLEASAGFSGTVVKMKMLVRLLTGAGFVYFFLQERERLRYLLVRHNLPVLFFVFWAMLGLHRAQDPWIPFFRLGELFAFFLIGHVLQRHFAPTTNIRHIVRWHSMALVPICITAGVFLLIEPDLAAHKSADGTMRIGHQLMNANVLAFAAVIVALWGTFELRCGREHMRSLFFEQIVPLAAVVGGGLVLYYARSRTSSITFLLGQAILWFPRGGSGRGSPVTKFALLLLAAAAFGIQFEEQLVEWFMRGDDVETLATGTGRTDLWHLLITEQAPKSPLLGAGYLMLSEHGRFEHAGAAWNNAHNSFVFALVSTGIPGCMAVLSIVLLPLWRARRAVIHCIPEERESRIMVFALMVVIGITSVTGFGIAGHPNVAMLFHYGLYAMCVAPLPEKSRFKSAEPGLDWSPPANLEGAPS